MGRAKGHQHAAHGGDAFEAYYRDVFGERWAALRASMIEPARGLETLSTGGTTPYYMDAASILAASCAGAIDRRSTLDMCAAPGGKTLVLALSSRENDCRIVANDRSSVRRSRLYKVLDGHLDPALRANVMVTGHDARRWGIHEPESYELVLADVPCSSEAHLLSGKGSLDKWSRARIKQVTSEQFAILRAATQAAKPGGKVIYSTCSLLPEENEQMVERAIARSERKGPRVRPLALESSVREYARELNIVCRESGAGYRVWPDENDGAGPIFFSLLERCD